MSHHAVARLGESGYKLDGNFQDGPKLAVEAKAVSGLVLILRNWELVLDTFLSETAPTNRCR